MNSLKFYFIFIFLSIVNVVFGSIFQQGKVIYLKGDVKEGFFEIPNNPDEKIIKFKTGIGSAQIETIQSSDLKYISVQSEDGNNYLFERISCAYKLGGKPQKPIWLFVNLRGYATLYVSSPEYVSDENGNVLLQYSYNVRGDIPTYNYFIKKGNEDIAYYFGMTGASNMLGMNGYLRKVTVPYLVDYPELVARIKNKEFTHKDYKGIVQLYNEYMKDLKPIEQL